MTSQNLKDRLRSLLATGIQTPSQYIGGELGTIVKDHKSVRGKLCLAFPDAYSIGMSHHGFQMLYHLMNLRDDWACERAFTPWLDMEAMLRKENLPLYGLETGTPLSEFDVVGFTMQYELCVTNILTMLDLGRIPIRADERTLDDPLVIAGGPQAFSPEPMSPFIDLFVIGDGEEMLPRVCDAWLEARAEASDREEALARLATTLPHVYVPRFYRVDESCDGLLGSVIPTRDDVPREIFPAVIKQLDEIPIVTHPIVPQVECVQERITIEIMRGCPWTCKFCQSSKIKHPVRFRSVDSIVRAAEEAYKNSGFNEISLLSLSTSDYPWLEELLTRLQETFRPLNVSISVPSLRVNEHLSDLSELLNTDRRGSLTIAPEAAREEMRQRIGKNITDDDLFEGCRRLFAKGFDRVKLYFMCGLPGEEKDDIDGMFQLADEVSRIGKEVRDRWARVSVSVSNLIPKPHTSMQHHAMARREHLAEVHSMLRRQRLPRSISAKYHDIDSSLLEAVICRGDRRLGAVIETLWHAGARFDAWSDYLKPNLWWDQLAAAGIDLDAIIHTEREFDAPTPWSHIKTTRLTKIE